MGKLFSLGRRRNYEEIEGEIMDIIGFFSAFLAEKLEKDVSTTRGLLRIAIKDQFGSMPSNIDFDDLHQVFNKALRNRLMKLNIIEL